MRLFEALAANGKGGRKCVLRWIKRLGGTKRKLTDLDKRE